MTAPADDAIDRSAVLEELAALLQPDASWPGYDQDALSSHPAFGWALEARAYGDPEYSMELASRLAEVAALAAEKNRATDRYCYYRAALDTGAPPFHLAQLARRMLTANLSARVGVLMCLHHLDRDEAVDIGRTALRLWPVLQQIAVGNLIGLFSPTERAEGVVDCCELLDVSPEAPSLFLRAAHFLLAASLPGGRQEALEVHLPELDPDDSAYTDGHHTSLTDLAADLNDYGVDDALALAARRWAGASTQAPRWVDAALAPAIEGLRADGFDSWAELEPWSVDYWSTLEGVVTEWAEVGGPSLAYVALDVLAGHHGADAEDRAVAADIIGLLVEEVPQLASEMRLAEGLLAVVGDEWIGRSVDDTLGMSVARALGCFTDLPHVDRVEILGALGILQASDSEPVRDQALEALARLSPPEGQPPHATVELESDSVLPVELNGPWPETLKLYRWQQEALQLWLDGGRCGVIEAVTGAGKTRLALAVIAEAVSRGRPVAVLVPGRQLLDQWRREIEQQLQGRAGLSFSIGELHGDSGGSLASADVMLATLQSAARYDLDPSLAGSVLIVDEVHRAGAPAWSAALDPYFTDRLGLTATYEREGDLGIEEHLDPFFGGVCASVGYGEALRDGVIAPFKVAYVGVRFTPGEQLEYDEVAHRAATLRRKLIVDWGCPAEPFGVFLKAVHRLSASGVAEGSKLAGFYLSAFSKRRAVLSNASGKLDRLQDLAPAVRDADKTVVFTQTKQAASEAVAVLADGQIDGAVLHAGMDLDARARVFGGFEDGTHELVAAPRLLDEGVDVPAADLGLVLAASRSRRQMIQRMGRILRRKTDGRPARFVIMFVEDSSEDPDQPGHEGFLELITPHAIDVQRFDATTLTRTINAYLRPLSRAASSTADTRQASSDALAEAPASREHIARALVNKGNTFSRAGRYGEASQLYDEVIRRFGEDDSPAIREQVARALAGKGVKLFMDGRDHEAIRVYEEVVTRFQDDDSPAIREQVAKALLTKGMRLKFDNLGGEAIGVYDEVITRFEGDDTPAIREQVDRALFERDALLAAGTRRDEMISRFEDDDIPAVREQVAKALLTKAFLFREDGCDGEAIRIYDAVVARFGGDDDPAVREEAARALRIKSILLLLGGHDE